MARRRGTHTTRQTPTTHDYPIGHPSESPATVDRGALYRAFFEDANDVFAVFGLDDSIVLINPEVERLLGYRREEVEGQPYAQLLTPEAATIVNERNQHLQAGERVPPLFEIELLRKDGTRVPVEARTRSLRDSSGQVSGYLGIFRNIAERKQHEAERNERAEEYRTLIETMHDVVYVLDGEAPILLRVNPAFEHVTGWSTTEWLHNPNVFPELVHPDDLLPTLELYQRSQRGEVLPHFQMRIRCKDGVYRVGEFSASPRLREGKVVEIVGVARDVTERMKEQQQLEEQRRLLIHIAEAMPEVVFLYEASTQHIRYVTTRLTICLGYTPEYIQGLETAALRALVHPEDLPTLADWESRLASAADGEWVQQEVRIRHANGAYRWLQSSNTVCTRTAEGAPEQILGLVHDITTQKRLAALLQDRTILYKELGAHLQKFRESLKMTQPEFGAYFGGYNQRKISTYERGRIEIPLGLLLNIRAKGFPWEAILGTGGTVAIDQTVEYMATSYTARVVAARLAEALTRLLHQDRATIEHVLSVLDRPIPTLDAEQRRVLDQLAQVDKLVR